MRPAQVDSRAITVAGHGAAIREARVARGTGPPSGTDECTGHLLIDGRRKAEYGVVTCASVGRGRGGSVRSRPLIGKRSFHVKTAITELFGIQHPIIQGGMSLILDHVRLAPSVKKED